MRLPTPQTSSTGIRASSRRWRSMFDKSTTLSVWRCHFFAAWLASLARVFVWAMPTPTVRCVRFRTVALISRPKSVRSRQFRTPLDHKSLINAVNFYPRHHLLECGHYPVRHISVKLVITAEANNTGSPEAFFLFEVWLTWCDTELLRLGATRDNAAIIV